MALSNLGQLVAGIIQELNYTMKKSMEKMGVMLTI
jgi:hypothetical protein